jgi:hypothetical protein
MAAQITKAAVSGAPAEAQSIVAALCKTRPASFYSVGAAAAEVAPKAGNEILAGISSSAPMLGTLIAQAKKDLRADQRAVSVATVLKRANSLLETLAASTRTTSDAVLAREATPELTAKLASTALSMPPPPVIGPPYTPAGPPPNEIPVTDTFEAPPVGRDYSTP